MYNQKNESRNEKTKAFLFLVVITFKYIKTVFTLKNPNDFPRELYKSGFNKYSPGSRETFDCVNNDLKIRIPREVTHTSFQNSFFFRFEFIHLEANTRYVFGSPFPR